MKLGEILRGGTAVVEAEKRIEELTNKPHLSRREKVQLARTQKFLGRRRLLAGGAGLVGATALSVADLNPIVWAVRSLPHVNNPTADNNPGQAAFVYARDRAINPNAENVRRQIREFEEGHIGPVTKDDVKKLFNFSAELYKETFGKLLPVNLSVISLEEARNQNLREEEFGRVLWYSAKPPIIRIFLGNNEANTTPIKNISTFRAIVMHNFVYSQAPLLEERRMTKVGNIQFMPDYRMGFQWGKRNQRDFSYFGTSFDAINTQLLTEYINDPTDQDDIFIRMTKTPPYNAFFSLTLIEGTRLLKDVYMKLGISIDEVEKLRSSSQSVEFLTKIDRMVGALGISLREPASSVFVRLNLQDTKSETQLRPLVELSSQVVKSFY